METIKFADLEAKVLDPDEFKQAMTTLTDVYAPRVEKLSQVHIPLPGGKTITGDNFFKKANNYNEQVNLFSLEWVQKNDAVYEKRMNILAEFDPDFSEIYHVNGRNILAGALIVEKAIYENLESVTVPPFNDMLDCTLKDLSRARTYFETAIRLLQPTIKQHPELKFYETEIRFYLACAYRREAFLRTKTEAITEELDEIKEMAASNNDPRKHPAWKKYGNVGLLTLKSLAEFKTCFDKGIFRSKDFAAMNLANMANSMKIFINKGNIAQALEYYRLARSVLGPVKEIEEGIKYYESINPIDFDLLRFIARN